MDGWGVRGGGGGWGVRGGGDVSRVSSLKHRSPPLKRKGGGLASIVQPSHHGLAVAVDFESFKLVAGLQ